jgi:hypothetical protein
MDKGEEMTVLKSSADKEAFGASAMLAISEANKHRAFSRILDDIKVEAFDGKYSYKTCSSDIQCNVSYIRDRLIDYGYEVKQDYGCEVKQETGGENWAYFQILTISWQSSKG